ncbi:MAG: ribonuclease III [Lachnospiraceae bacterium]|nr:ribonuclease III [Lachnospiraceae bacterium]MDD3659165.1 ribonuclease III [Lachnospiraceae bacterium]
MKDNDLTKLEQVIQYQFCDKELLKQAVTHSSFSNEQKILKLKNYERLEFLGDAVLELISSEYLFMENQDIPEGELTKMRSSCVCEPSLAFCAREISLGDYILLGKGEESTGGRERDSILADVCEAVLGAIYLDGGFEHAKAFVFRFILSDLENKKLFYDSKTILQEMIQKDNKSVLHYHLIAEEGPDHDKTFSVEARLGEETIGSGKGRTKKAAEQKAAYQALVMLKNIKR